MCASTNVPWYINLDSTYFEICYFPVNVPDTLSGKLRYGAHPGVLLDSCEFSQY